MIPWIEADTELSSITDGGDVATSGGTATPSLVCVSGPDIGTTFPVGNGTVVIGRDRVDIVLSETEVSRRHAKIQKVNNGYQLEDLGSSNGTILNGTRIVGTMPVRLGDRIQIGRTVLVFAHHDALADRVARMQRLEAIATLAGGIAHDFNNALSVIMFNLDIVGEELPEGQGRQSLDEIRAATATATALARRLLRLGRPEQLPFAPVALEELATRTVSMAHRRSKIPLDLSIKIPRDLRVNGSYDELHQVLFNLCINAVDAMPNGGSLAIVAKKLHLSSDDATKRQVAGAGDYIELLVTDSGHGMDKATLGRLFEPFFTTKPKDQGTGLGLAMIHSSVRRHHGSIDVHSVVGSGTTFRITLPAIVE